MLGRDGLSAIINGTLLVSLVSIWVCSFNALFLGICLTLRICSLIKYLCTLVLLRSLEPLFSLIATLALKKTSGTT